MTIWWTPSWLVRNAGKHGKSCTFWARLTRRLRDTKSHPVCSSGKFVWGSALPPLSSRTWPTPSESGGHRSHDKASVGVGSGDTAEYLPTSSEEEEAGDESCEEVEGGDMAQREVSVQTELSIPMNVQIFGFPGLQGAGAMASLWWGTGRLLFLTKSLADLGSLDFGHLQQSVSDHAPHVKVELSRPVSFP